MHPNLTLVILGKRAAITERLAITQHYIMRTRDRQKKRLACR